MPQYGTYRDPLIQVVLVLLLFILAFLAVTVMGRRSWASLGARESLLARLAGAAVLAAIASPAATSMPFALLSIVSRYPQGFFVETTQTQAIVVVLIAIGLTVAAAARIEMLHRRALGLIPPSEADDWELETPDPPARRRTP